MITRPDIRLLLDNIRSVHNVGSIFRTAECAGVSKLYLCGTTPTPLDRFGRARADLAKVALGAENLVEWEQVSQVGALITKLRKQGYSIVAIEQDKKSMRYDKIPRTDKVLFILGNEVGGVSPELLGMADHIAEIPMKGTKESLNVSVTAGIVVFDYIRH